MRKIFGAVIGLALASLVVGGAWARVMGDSNSPTGDGRPDFTRRTQHAVLEDDLYKSPVKLLLSRDDRQLYVTCERTGEVIVVDTRRGRVIGQVKVGREPFGMALSPDEGQLYVSNRWDNEVAVVDLEKFEVTRRIPVGDDPHGLTITGDGRYLFVANLATNDLSVLDLKAGTEIKRLSMGMAPFETALSPDGRSLYVSSQFSIPVPFRTPSILELTAVDVPSQTVRHRYDLYSTVVGQGVAVSPDGHFAVTVLALPKNLIPETQVYQGFMVTYGFAITETRPSGRTAYLLIDKPNLYFADPFDLAFTPNGRFLYISSSGADFVSVIDMEQVYALLAVEKGRIGISGEKIEEYARHLALSNEYIAARIQTGPIGANPKGLAISSDGRRVYVANRLQDNIAIIDTRRNQVVGAIELGGPDVMTTLRWGERLFNYASISFHKQMSCTTCHPEHGVDGLSYDIAVDGGLGRNLVDNLTLRGIAETAPFKWTGKNPDLERQEGPRAAQLFFRTHGFEGPENQAIVAFIESIPPRPNRYLPPDGTLNEFQEWGKTLFERAYDNMGRYIPVANRCVTCHPKPYGTDSRIHDVGTRNYHDQRGIRFVTPHLINTYERPPFMHDGRCYSLEEIWTEHNDDDTHGVANDMTKEELNAMIEYIKTF